MLGCVGACSAFWVHVAWVLAFCFTREFSHGSGACALEVMMQDKGDPGSPTRAENGHAGVFVGAGQSIPPSFPSSNSQGAKGGSVSGLGKGYGANVGFQQSYMPGPYGSVPGPRSSVPGSYGMGPRTGSFQPGGSVGQQGIPAFQPNFSGNQQQ